MKLILLAILSLCMFLLSCATSITENNLTEQTTNDLRGKSDFVVPADYYKSVQTMKIIPGSGIGLLKIEETRSKDLFDETYTEEFYQKNGIELQFRNGDTLTGIVLENDGNYVLNESIKIGLTEDELIQSIGKPEGQNIPLKKGQKKIGELHSLNYPGFSIIFIDDKKSVISIFKKEL